MIAWSWESTQVLIAVLAPLVGVPLGVITFYLRWLHENQLTRHAELVRRFELIERMGSELARTVAGFALDYTTKEEWLRECMYARGRIERLAELLAETPGTRHANERTNNPRTSDRADRTSPSAGEEPDEGNSGEEQWPMDATQGKSRECGTKF